MKHLSEEGLEDTPAHDPVQEAAAIAEAVIENFRGLLAIEKAKIETKLRHFMWRILIFSYLALLSLFALGGFVFMTIWGSILFLTELGLSYAVASLTVGALPLVMITIIIYVIQRKDKAKSLKAKLNHLHKINVLREQRGE